MNRLPALVLAILAAAVLCEAGAAAEAPVVKVVGLQVMAPRPDKPQLSVVEGHRGGTWLYVQVARATTHFIDLDAKASTVASFTDDKGTTLLAPKARSLWDKPISGQVATGGGACTLQFYSSKTPAPGASKLSVKATAVLRCGAGRKTVEQKALALKAGSAITVGPVPMTVKDVRPSSWGKSKLVVELGGESDDKAIQGFTFLGSDGKEIPHAQLGHNRFRMGTKVRWSRTIGLEQKIDVVAVKIAYFERLESLTVPVEVTASLGF